MSSKIHGASELDFARLVDPSAADATEVLWATQNRAGVAEADLRHAALQSELSATGGASAGEPAHSALDAAAFTASPNDIPVDDARVSALLPSSDSAMSGLHGDATGGGGTTAITGSLWIGADAVDTDHTTGPDPDGTYIGFVNSDGSGLKVTVNNSTTGYGEVAVDPADGLWFAESSATNPQTNVGQSTIVAGHTTGGNGSPDTGTQTQTFFPVPTENNNSNPYNVNGLTIDKADHYLYLAYVGPSDAATGIARISYDPATGVMGSETQLFTSTMTGLQAPDQLDYNASDHLIYYVDSNNYSNNHNFDYATNGIYTVDPTNASAAPIELTKDSQFVSVNTTNDYANGNIIDVAVNAAQGVVYFVTQNTAIIAGGNDGFTTSEQGTSEDAIWYVSTGSSGQTAVELALPSGVTLESALANSFTYDPSGNDLYVGEQSINSSGKYTNNIIELALNGTGTAVASGQVTNDADGSTAFGLTFVAGPAVTLNHASASYTGEASAITLLPTLALSDPNGAAIISATVTLTGGYANDGDVLSINGSTDGLSVATSGSGSTETLTLSGTASAATYQAVLQALQFHTTTADPTNGGADTTRTLSVQATDLGQATGSGASSETLTLTALTKPVLSDFVSPTGEAVQGGAPELALSQEAPAVTSGAPITSASVTITNAQAGDELTVIGLSNGTVDGGAVTVGGVGTSTLTFTGSASAAEYSGLFAAVTYQDAGSDTASGAHPSRTISWTASNADGAAVQPASTSITIDRVPVVANVSLTVAAGATGSADAGHGLLSTASDPDGDTPSITAIDGQAGYVGQQQDGSNGDVTINADGSYSFTTAASPTGPTGSPVTEVASFTVSDGHGGLTTADLTVTIDRAPTVAAHSMTVASTSSVSGTDGPTGSGALGGASDPDTASTTFSVEQVTPSGGQATVVNGDTNIYGTYGALAIDAAGGYAYTPGATQGEIDAIAAVSGSHPVDGFTLTVGDTDGPATASESLSFTIERAPVVMAGGAASYTEGAGAAVADGGLTLSDPDGDTIASASVSIGGFASGDVLSATGANGIAVSYDSGAGILTLTGGAAAADYQAVLDGVTFSAATETVAAHQAAAGADETRTLSYMADDGTLNSSAATSTVAVAIVIADTAAHIASALDSLDADASVSSIQITDSQPLSITDTQFNDDTTALALIAGAHEVDVSGVTGASYTGFDIVFDANGDVTSKTYTGISGQTYTSEVASFDVSGQKTTVDFYDAQDDLLQEYSFTYGANGAYTLTEDQFSPARAYSSVQEDYGAGGVLSDIVYSGYSTEPYTSQTKDYDSAGVLTSETFSGFSGAYASEVKTLDNSGQATQETFYDAQNNLVQEYSFTYGSNGAYTQTENDFSPARAYTSLEKDYGTGGVLTGETYSGFSGAYASLSETFDSMGRPSTKSYYDSADALVEKLAYAYSGAHLASITGSDITGQPYTGFLKHYAVSGALASETLYETNGSEHATAYASGVTFATDGSTQTLTLVDGDIVSIGSGFGKVSISGYNGPDGGNEVFDVSKTTFTDFDDLLAHAHASGGNTVVDDGAGQLDFVNVTFAQLSQHGSDFHFM